MALIFRLTLTISAFFICSPLAALGAPAPPDPGPANLDQSAALLASQAVVGKTVSDFTLLNREGRPIRLSQYRGKPLLVSFIYTGCFQVCPVTTRSLQRAIKAGQNVFRSDQFNVVSIGFNQPADSPQSLKSFALKNHIDAPNWEFLSPHASIVEPLTREFGFNYTQTAAGFDHVLQATLLDANGRIYKQIYGAELDAQAIGEPLVQLLRETPVPQHFQLADFIDRVRIVCTYYDPNTGRYRFKYGLLIEVAGGITFALAMLWFFLGEWRARRRACRANVDLDHDADAPVA